MIPLVHTDTPFKAATAGLNACLADARGHDVLLLLSGGSALALIDTLDVSLLGPHVTVSVLDERWTTNPKHSNYAQLTTLPVWTQLNDQGVQMIDPRPRDVEDLYDTSKRFDLALKHWHITHRDGNVIATMGIGDDGHTAGILPFPSEPEKFATLFTHTTTCIRGYTVEPTQNPHTKRMTATLTYLVRHIDHAMVYAIGEGKRQALKKVMAPDGDEHVTPARVLQRMKGVTVYTDVAL